MIVRDCLFHSDVLSKHSGRDGFSGDLGKILVALLIIGYAEGAAELGVVGASSPAQWAKSFRAVLASIVTESIVREFFTFGACHCFSMSS